MLTKMMRDERSGDGDWKTGKNMRKMSLKTPRKKRDRVEFEHKFPVVESEERGRGDIPDVLDRPPHT